MKVRLISIGKSSPKWIEDAVEEYLTRLRSHMNITTLWAKKEQQFLEIVEKEDPSSIFLLDERGKTFKSSKEFSDWFFSRHDAARHKEINFVIGGAEGFPNPAWKNRYQSISLSNLTLTHQMARVVLLEQIYRSMEIEKGTKYHK